MTLRNSLCPFLLVLAFAACMPARTAPAAEQGVAASPSPTPRARDLGVPFEGTPGAHNAVTDVPGVRVGHTTLIEGDGARAIRTGVTAILPAPRGQRLFAATFDINGNGEMTGSHLVDEWGLLLSPIVLTNTLSVGAAHEAVVRWSLLRKDHPRVNLPVVAETWDGRLNDIDGLHVRAHHVQQALNQARSGPVAEGNVGGGTGMVAYGFKGGIGTASRVVASPQRWTVGVLVQANHGRRERLRIAGVPVGARIDDLRPELHAPTPIEGSIIVVVATDAPLLPHQLARVAKRAAHGIARTGAISGTWSGDMVLAFSTAAPRRQGEGTMTAEFLVEDGIDRIFEGAVQATEEAIVNALVAAETMVGYRGNRVYELPHDRLEAMMKDRGADPRARSDQISE